MENELDFYNKPEVRDKFESIGTILERRVRRSVYQHELDDNYIEGKRIIYHEPEFEITEDLVKQLLWHHLKQIVDFQTNGEIKIPIFDEYQKKQLKKIVKILVENKKGIYLCGDYRTGKTTLMNAIIKTIERLNILKFGHKIDYNKLLLRLSSDGNLTALESIKGHCYLDDLGYDNKSVIKQFGNEENVITKLIYLFDLNFKRRHKLAFVTSNLTPKEIRESHGEGTYGRMLDIFECILWKGENKSINKI